MTGSNILPNWQGKLVNMQNNADRWILKAEVREKSGLPALRLSSLPVLWFSVLLTLFGLILPCVSEIVDFVVSVVNDEPVTLSMVEDAMNGIWTEPQDTPRSQQAALQKLIDHKLKLQEARRLGTGVIVSEERLSLEIRKVASRFTSSKEPFEALRQQGISQEYLAEKLVEEIMVQEKLKFGTMGLMN